MFRKSLVLQRLIFISLAPYFGDPLALLFSEPGGIRENKFKRRGAQLMSIQKKSLISTLKTAKKAHVASAPEAGNAKGTKGVKMVKAIRAIKAIKAMKAMKAFRATRAVRALRLKKA